jgi:hypothetical protein
MTAQEARWRISAELCSRKQSDPTAPYPLVNTSPHLVPCPLHFELKLNHFGLAAGTRRTKWKRHHPPAPSPRPRLPPRGLDPAFPSRAWPRGAPGCSRRRPRPAPSPPPARRWWSPARHRRRTPARTTPRTPRSTAPAASAAPAPHGNSRCESRRFPSFSSYVLRFIFFCAALELGFGCGSLLLEVKPLLPRLVSQDDFLRRVSGGNRCCPALRSQDQRKARSGFFPPAPLLRAFVSRISSSICLVEYLLASVKTHGFLAFHGYILLAVCPLISVSTRLLRTRVCFQQGMPIELQPYELWRGTARGWNGAGG